MFFGGSFEQSFEIKDNFKIATTDEILQECASGNMFILVDDPDRENEGDLVIAGAHATPEAISFMARFGRGLICLAISSELAKQFKLELQPRRNVNGLYTAFTTSIDARQGITTGISASDRSLTVSLMTKPDACEDDLVTPGHMFPIVANNDGVLGRPGHTEASVQLAQTVGLPGAAVICEILGDDGEAMRLPQLRQFAQIHQIKIGTIADLKAWVVAKNSISL